RLNVAEAGSFRYSYLLEHQNMAPLKRDRFNVFVALPIDPSAALQLQEQMIRLLDNPSYSRIHFQIKSHPHLSARFVLAQRLQSYPNCELINKSVREVLPESRLCVSVDSTVALEAVFSGVPTINFIPEDITQGIEQIIRDYSFCATEKDFEAVFNAAMQTTERPRMNIGDYFSTVRYQLFYDEVKLNRDRFEAGAL
ncbi:MAG: hypothetical protein K8I00_01430, partial [Candidatus Omnitrophica bacterium]|nr:hypothetical protein [Candidatus Omnitrophota bacterium]